jgi:hypothetical protein
VKPIIVIYLSRSFYQMGNDSVKEIMTMLESPNDQYHLFVFPSSDDATTIDVFPKYVLVDNKETFQGLIGASDSLQESIDKLNNIMSVFFKN